MLIINDIEVTKADLESILRSIQFMQKKHEEGKTEDVKWTLDVLESHLRKNLEEDAKYENNI